MALTNFKSLLITVFVIHLGCNSEKITTEPIEPKPFPVKNTPEHVFKMNVEKLKDTITSFFDFENQFENKILDDIFCRYYDLTDSVAHRSLLSFYAETNQSPLFGKEYFAKPNTENDIYIHCYGEVWLSKLYFSKGRPLEYRTPFIIKLAKADSISTKVTIVAENPRVLNGISHYTAHGPAARQTSVEPSSIEEYSILLFIASKLGDTTLLPLKVPRDN
ncbi:MAG TPA: hypothetical protein PKA77_18035 [Chitinophagaceae bacterium]|jgi:hypothetical protein|nr:hypothetical protein [Chitinophagaceae bacterium]